MLRRRNVRFHPVSDQIADIAPRQQSAIRRHMQCSKQPVNLGAFGQVLGSLTDYNLASADEDDLSVLRGIAPSHHGYIVEINPNGLCFEIGALHPRCHCRSLSLPGLILLQSKLPLRLPARAARQLPDQSTTLRAESSSLVRRGFRALCQHVWRIFVSQRESTKGRPKPPELVCTVPRGTIHSYSTIRHATTRTSDRTAVHATQPPRQRMSA